jgi:predicted  nucleic acid-binding Zn-ribbon protein
MTIQEIRALAWQSQEQIRPIPLTEEELSENRERFSSLLDEQDDEDFRFSETKQQYNSEKKTRMEEVKRLRKLVRYRFQERRVVVHYVPNYDAGMMELYDNEGNLFETRRLRPEERQERIPITATNIHSITEQQRKAG